MSCSVSGTGVNGSGTLTCAAAAVAAAMNSDGTRAHRRAGRRSGGPGRDERARRAGRLRVKLHQ